MVHTFSDILFSGQHYTQPFTCSCAETDPNQMHKHCLTVSQKVAAFVIAFLIAITTFVVGGIAAFYILTAAFKARNSVWSVYGSEYPHNRSYSIFIPAWWGITSNPTIIVRKQSNYNYRGGGEYTPTNLTFRTNVSADGRRVRHYANLNLLPVGTSSQPARNFESTRNNLNQRGFGGRQIPGIRT